jgi:cell division protein FtsW
VSARNRGLHIDAVTVALVAAIVLLGLIMVTSASISIATREGGDPFAFLERQLMLCLVGFLLAAMVFCVRTEFLEKMAWPLLIAAVVLLFVVLIPGLGHTVNGSRRWIRVLGFNFQASELARVLTLIFIASYAVRRESELRTTAMGLIKPMALLGFVALLLLAEPDFGAASVLFVTGFGILFIAGARLRYVVSGAAAVIGAGVMLVVMAPYRMQRVTSFLDPWADPFNSGFQLTQSLIAIGRGEWFGVGLGESVQKLFYLPEAHTDFLFAVLAEELGLVGVLLTLSLFIGLVWRSFFIAQLASRAGLAFQSYLALGFGLWLGAQALINIGVNMGVLPTKGLTLPLMSYGRSSMIVALAWVGLLLRVYHEAVQQTRGMATVRRSDGGRSDDADSRPLRAAGSAA